jgi:nucleotide-binding universal stress UspA family protein
MNGEEPAQGARTFIVGVDGSRPSYAALAEGQSLGGPSHARLVVTFVRHRPLMVDASGMAEAEISKNLDAVTVRVRDEVRKRLDAYPGLWHFEARDGDPTRELLSSAAEHNADLIIVGHHGHRLLTDVMLGSVATRLTHHAPISVLVVVPSEHG